MDKSFQSLFQFIHVLPGAFSAYSMAAIWVQDSIYSDKLLTDYFSSILDKLHTRRYLRIHLSFWQICSRLFLPSFISKRKSGSISQIQDHQDLMSNSNINLAQDRILCMGIHQNKKKLIFLPDAYSYVDPVKDLPSLMGQRKRWINGSFFAFDKVYDQFRQEVGCFHLLGIQINYLAFMNILIYIAPGLFLFTISIAMQTLKRDILVNLLQNTIFNNEQFYNLSVYLINFFYSIFIFGMVFYSVNLNNRNKDFIKFVYKFSNFLGVMAFIIMKVLIFDIIKGMNESDYSSVSSSISLSNRSNLYRSIQILRYIILSTFGVYLFPIILYSIIFKSFRIIPQIISGVFSFIFYQPTYILILNIYAICKIDDLSWGTKGLQENNIQQSDQRVLKTWKHLKNIYVGKFLLWNIIVGATLIRLSSLNEIRFWMVFCLVAVIAFLLFAKVLFAIFYYIYYKLNINTKPKNIDEQKCGPSLYEQFDPQIYGEKNLNSQLRLIIRQNVIDSFKRLKIHLQQQNLTKGPQIVDNYYQHLICLSDRQLIPDCFN